MLVTNITKLSDKRGPLNTVTHQLNFSYGLNWINFYILRMDHMESAGPGSWGLSKTIKTTCGSHGPYCGTTTLGHFIFNNRLAFCLRQQCTQSRGCILIGNRALESINFALSETHFPSHLCNGCGHVIQFGPMGFLGTDWLSDLVTVA